MEIKIVVSKHKEIKNKEMIVLSEISPYRIDKSLEINKIDSV